MQQSSTSSWRHFDFWLLGAVALLVIFGITMIRSAVAGNIELIDLNLVQRQIIFALIGFAIILGAAAIDYHLWASLSRTLYILTFALLMILFIVGAAFYGSARWFDTGIILIQPSEIAKVVLILTLANFFSRNIDKIGYLRTIVSSFAFTMGITIWILLQPNLSTSIVMIVIWFGMLFASGVSWKHLIAFAGAAIIIPVAAFPFLVDYQQRRILNFLFPDPNASYGESYNIRQALIAIGSGGWFGQGYGHGSQVQLRFLKVRWSDFIFSSMAQEFGFIGVFVVLLVFVFVIYRILRAARMARDTYGALICYGVAAMLAFQAIVNAGVNLNLMPATGLTFPFISYGGSSLLSALLGVGLVESVILRHKSLEF
jgi:rod shape determining protein RodA